MVQLLLCDVYRWTTGQRDAKLRDARRGGGHGPQAADGGGGGSCDEVVSQGEKVSSLLQTDWHTVAFRRGNVALWTANKRRSRTIIHDVFLITSEFRSLWTRYWTTDFCCLTVRSRAVSGEPDTPPAGRAGQTWEAAAAQRSQVRRRAREEKVDLLRHRQTFHFPLPTSIFHYSWEENIELLHILNMLRRLLQVKIFAHYIWNIHLIVDLLIDRKFIGKYFVNRELEFVVRASQM